MLPMRQVAVLTSVGAILVLLCSIFLGVFPLIFNSIVSKMLVVREDSPTFDAFITPPIPVYMQFYLFNVTNPKDITDRGAKPILQEVGPYTYEEIRVKYDFEWDEEEGTVRYLQNKTFVFVEDMSDGHLESDYITTINAVMVLAASVLHEDSLVPMTIWSQLEYGMDLFENHTAGELLFNGYALPTFDFDFSDFDGLVPQLNITEGWTGTLGDILTAMGAENLPSFLEENLIGLQYGMNGSNDKTYEVKTGAKGTNDFLNIVAWNNQSSLDFWNDTNCNAINGTDGSQYPPRLTKSSILRIYTSEMCRSMYLTYEKDLKYHGIPVYRFIPPKAMLEDPLINPDNLCYCVPDRDHCLGAGMLNLQPCAGVPIILSTPHFYQGDDEEREKLVGLNPLKEHHETTLDVEPRSGVTMRAMKRIQFNVPLKRYANLPTFKNVPEVIFPILWVNESAAVDEESAKTVRGGVFVPFQIVNGICGSLIAIGAIMLIVGGIKYLHIRHSRGQRKL